MLHRSCAIVLVSLLCAGDAHARPVTPDSPHVMETIAGSVEMDRLFSDYWDEYLQLDPITATYSGDDRYNDQLPNFLSAEHRRRVSHARRTWLQRLRAIDAAKLEGQTALSHQILISTLQQQLDGERFPDWMMPVNQFFSFPGYLASLGSGSGPQPFATVQDHDAWLARGVQAPALFDQAIANMREGMAVGVVQPRVLMERMVPQLEAVISDDPEQTPFWHPVARFPEAMPEEDRARLVTAYRQLIREQLVPAYRRLRDFLIDEYIPAARTSYGLGALPDGAAWYAYLARTSTTTVLTPDEIHDIGVQEVARIRSEMETVKERIGFAGDLQAFFRHMAEDPDLAFESEQEMLDEYRALEARIMANVPGLFSLMPKAGFEIRPVEPFRAATAGVGSYLPPSQDGTHPGIFQLNTSNLPERRTWMKESLFLHEAIPGHHFQIALQQELPNVPAFRRFTWQIAYVEGWGLYAESLGKDLGVYTDPHQYFGRLSEEAKRAARLVVDTGLHARGWTREQAIAYLRENAGLGSDEAVAQIERYMAIPGQALGYKIGELKITELRNRAEAALGDRFDVREFHAAVLGDGSVPLDLLEARIDRWIENRREGVGLATDQERL